MLGTGTPPEARGTVLALNRRAAARLGARPQRLDAYAHRLVLEAGQAVATPTLAHRLLTGAVQAALGTAESGLLARAMSSAVRELLRGGLDVTWLSLDESPQVRRLSRVTALYQEALREHGVIDPVEVVRRAADVAQPELLTVFGYSRLSADQLRFLQAAAGEGSVVALPWEDHPYFAENAQAALMLGAQGWAVERREAPSAGLAGAFLGRSGGAGALHVAASADDELRVALRQVKGLLRRGVDAADIALVVNDDDLWAPRVRAVAWEYGIPVQFSTSVPLADTRPGRWLDRVLTAVEDGLAFDALTRVLAHPLDAGMDGAVWQQARVQRPHALHEWQALGLDAGGFDWPLQASRADWVACVTSLIGARGLADRAARTQDLLALNFLRAELAVLAAPPSEGLTQGAFIQELREVLALVTVPSDPGSRGVELLTPLSLMGAQVPHVFVLGAADGHLPARLKDDPALDFMERRRLARAGYALDTAATLARRDAVTFWGLLQAVGETCTLSYARLGSAGEQAPSPHLARLPLTPAAPEAAACSPEEVRRGLVRRDGAYVDPALAAIRAAYQVEVRRLQRPDYDEYDGLTGQPLTPEHLVFSASQLAVLGRCTFRWWLEYGLKLRDQTADGLPSGLGRLRHGALAFAVQRAAWTPGADVRPALLDALEDGLRHAEEAEAWPQTPEWIHERRDVLAGLRQAVQGEGFIQAGAAPLDAERPFEGQWQGLRVRGVVDRVDQLGERLLIVDYKSGASRPLGVQDAAGRLGLDIQLPLYAQAALPALYPDGRLGGALYVSLQRGAVLSRLKLSPTELDAFGARVRAALTQGAFPPRPDADFKTCRTCPWTGVCRGGERLEGKVHA
ncbi:PD-(D/E)XK nuclease family protein [Deinococcus sp. 23YEL01]|uniref:PD-(D/E)XK nuclease family protein n=1 Tax=Deinococcus sp. 23YEL01 TaxID=2745871 RepID=UPI001E5A5797|nr:PD-(D/E)XK nuclease family protein [Deinococcus sp. 23YEL01]MCD0168603.1 PD-(D/E)XK nuclease family protein [Deinococcus sp. 23YEL01]